MADDRSRRQRRLGHEGDRRSEARERALLLLYEALTKQIPVDEVIAAQVTTPDELTVTLARGVEARCDELDALIADHARGWTLARMPLIDLTVMRIAGYELAARTDVPVAVVIDEAVELAKRFSTDESGRFVNGVLAALVPVLRAGTRTGHDTASGPEGADQSDER